MAERPTRYQKRTASDRQKVVALAEVTSIKAASEQTGIAESTIRYWMDDPKFADIRSRARESIVPELQVAYRVYLAAVVARASDPDAPLRELVDAFDRIGNRLALASGEATSRTEHRDLTDDDDADALNAAADAYLAARGIAPRGVGDAAREGAAPDGNARLHALPVPGGHPAGPLD